MQASSHTVESYYPALIAALEELNTLAAVWAAGSPTPSEYEADTKKMVETMQELNASLSPVEPTLEMNVVKALRSLAETVDALPGRMMHAATGSFPTISHSCSVHLELLTVFSTIHTSSRYE